MVSFREWIARWTFVMVSTWALVTTLAVMGCGDQVNVAVCAAGEVAREDAACERKPCGPEEITLETGACQPVGLPPDMACRPGELALESGECQPAGVPPEACGEGFAGDGNGGCKAILPEDECPEGQMAIPGETSCREVAPCGDGPWGDIPVDVNTQFVDQAYAGGDSDGTMTRPWTKIQMAIDEAEDGDIVAVTDGSYAENVWISDKVRLWGRCPGLVEIRGRKRGAPAVLMLGDAATGTEIRSLAVTGEGVGLRVWGARDVTIEQVWVHGTESKGILAQKATRGRTSMVLKGSLVEQNHDTGVFVEGSDATIESTVVRATQPSEDGDFGRGIGVQNAYDTGDRASVTLRACVVEQNHEMGVFVYGSDATIEATVVRATPRADGTGGRGIEVQADDNPYERGSVTVRASLVEQNHEVGVFVEGSDATIESTVVRATQPSVDGNWGRGIIVQNDDDTGKRGSVTVRASLVEENHDVGVFVGGSDATIEATVIRATRPSADGTGGRGIGAQADDGTGERASVTVRASLVERNHEAGVIVLGSDATIESTVVRATQRNADEEFGWGIGVQDDPDTGERASVIVSACVVEQNQEGGVLVFGSDAMIEATVVRATDPSVDGDFGWGIGVQDDDDTGERGSAIVRASLVEQNHQVGVVVFKSDATIEVTIVRTTQARKGNTFGDGITIMNGAAKIQHAMITGNARAGVANFGSKVTILATILTCNAFDLNGETEDGLHASFEGSSGWQCTRRGAEDCAETDDRCHAETANLEPPPPVEPLPQLPQR
ncbi:right-handed parallel beta-helix repeat-containing protein [Sorangium sp. So ce291]|uniref:right-handed parallel beta-helix repeat-containing protein n=1 Tax=Sorangium sp. So ce291 TaxID=3133294 RepID=UPI003F5D7E57